MRYNPEAVEEAGKTARGERGADPSGILIGSRRKRESMFNGSGLAAHRSLAMLGHPPGSRHMRFIRAMCPIQLLARIDSQNDQSHRRAPKALDPGAN